MVIAPCCDPFSFYPSTAFSGGKQRQVISVPRVNALSSLRLIPLSPEPRPVYHYFSSVQNIIRSSLGRLVEGHLPLVRTSIPRPMAESCIILSPPAGTEAMPRNTEMGVKSRASVPEMPLHESHHEHTHTTADSTKEAAHARGVTESDSSDGDVNFKHNSLVDSATSNKFHSRASKRRIDPTNIEAAEYERGEIGTLENEGGATEATRPLHEQIYSVEPMDICYRNTPQSRRLKGVLIQRLDAALVTGRIQVIDLSRRGLVASDADLIASALRSNPQLAVLKLGYNDFGNKGAGIIASSCSKNGRHHARLTILDLGFNSIGDEGCSELSLHMVAGNHTLRNLFLSGNNIGKKGAMSLAGAILHGSSIAKLHLAANKLGSLGIQVLSGAIAEMETRRQHLLQRQGGIVIAAVKPQALEHLLLDGTNVKAKALVSLSSMLTSNQNLTVLGLSNNSIDDQGMAVISQALSQNKAIPLAAVNLSFNKITCTGVECFMNAIWGLQTLKEIKLDNNKMQDRGAQLCSVVLGAIPLAVLDISFNRVSTVGIKALMKSLSENDSLRVLSMSGMPLDQNACKAMSYALAYNQSLERFHIDSCCVGYSGQRHIVAGIVSNRNIKIRAFTGFPLGPITKTLGLPQIPEDWGNVRALSFIRYMWIYAAANDGGRSSTRGPAPPAAVAASGKSAFEALSASDACKIHFQQEHMSTQIEDSPITSPDTAILVRSESGQNLQIPAWGDGLLEDDDDWSDSESFDRSSLSEVSLNQSAEVSKMEPGRRNQNMQWLRTHLQSLTELGSLGFNNADLWRLHQYFFSPAYTISDEGDSSGCSIQKGQTEDSTIDEKSDASPSAMTDHQDEAAATSIDGVDGSVKSVASSDVDRASRPKKRSGLGEALRDTHEPSAKRAKNLRPRIAFFPRIREKLESLGTKPSVQTLSLLRQLKYIDTVLLQGKDVYTDEQQENNQMWPDALDVEMILLDLL